MKKLLIWELQLKMDSFGDGRVKENRKMNGMSFWR